MCSVLIIGMGRFGMNLAKKFIEQKDRVVVVDIFEDNVRELKDIAYKAQVADCTKKEALESFGVKNFDYCFVCMGSNFQASLEITSLLKDLGAKRVVSKASTDIHAKLLYRILDEKNGDAVVYPERDHARKLAIKYSSNIEDYTEISSDTGIFEIPILKSWDGHSIVELNIRNKYKINILAVKKGNEVISLPGANYVFDKADHVLVLGKKKDMDKFLNHNKVNI